LREKPSLPLPGEVKKNTHTGAIPSLTNKQTNKNNKHFHMSRGIHTEPFLSPIQSKEYRNCGAEQQHNEQ
jgi:hypothetical protein